ncbi:MAG: glutamyl-tRNA reductase, partial [Actinomycetales bacterium]
MSVLVVGLSHRTAPIGLLERASLDTDAAVKLAHRAVESPAIAEAAVVSTCNRVEVYVDAERFHGALEDVSLLLAEHIGLGREELVNHAYVHYDDAAVAHLFTVTAGLDSMILGESQILGQVRQALQTGQAESTVGSALNTLFQQALRIGKRGHAETGIDRLAPSTVTAGLDAAGAVVNDPATRFLVAGAGTMANLTVRTLVERGVDPARVMVANRTFQRAYELVATFGVSAVRWEAMDLELGAADVVVSCTGAAGVVLDRERIENAVQTTTGQNRPLTIIDLALPRDVDPEVSTIEGVTLIDLVVLAGLSENVELAADVAQVRTIVDDEVR